MLVCVMAELFIGRVPKDRYCFGTRSFLRMTHLWNVKVLLNFYAELLKNEVLAVSLYSKGKKHITSRLVPFHVYHRKPALVKSDLS